MPHFELPSFKRPVIGASEKLVAILGVPFVGTVALLTLEVMNNIRASQVNDPVYQYGTPGINVYEPTATATPPWLELPTDSIQPYCIYVVPGNSVIHILVNNEYPSREAMQVPVTVHRNGDLVAEGTS